MAHSSTVFESLDSRMKVADTDEGRQIRAQISDLRRLLDAYRAGAVLEDHKD